MNRDLAQMSMSDLFQLEAENQSQILTTGLLALERSPTAADQLEACMRAAHSVKGAARIVDIGSGVALAHAMEDCFVAAQEGRIVLNQEQIDVLFKGVDLLMSIAKTPDADPDVPAGQIRPDIESFIAELKVARVAPQSPTPVKAMPDGATRQAEPIATQIIPALSVEPIPEPANELRVSSHVLTPESEPSDRVLRVTVDNLNRLLGLAGESLVESRGLRPFRESLLRLKRLQGECAKAVEKLRDTVDLNERAQSAATEVQRRILECQQLLSQRLTELELSDRRAANLARRLYDQALACRMRPFADGVHGFPRMVRDVARSLGKQVRLEIVGLATQIDRDILEKLDAPLVHLVRNAVDHGIEATDERLAANKPAEGVVTLEARHSAGTLQIIISDDGRGVDLDALRRKVVERKLTNADTAAKMNENELLEFLFLPGFTTRNAVTEISGRGVGLDVVQVMVKQVRGTVRVSSRSGHGTRFQLQLPPMLSVVHALTVEIGNELFAFPLGYVIRVVKLARDKVELLEGRQHFNFEGKQVGLVTAHQMLGAQEPDTIGDELSIVLIGNEQHGLYGLVIDRFLGGHDLVVQPMDTRLGKIKDIAAAAVMEDGSPILIIDVEDMIHSIEKLAASQRLNKVHSSVTESSAIRRKRVLVVDDSLTVRELERKLLDHHGYDVEIAIDGMDGWNAARAGHFDLIITDIDMPRMDGIELVSLIKKHPTLKSVPVMIVSYKDREEDRQRGLNAGADYYLTKGSFHDDTLLQAVVDLIGEAVT